MLVWKKEYNKPNMLIIARENSSHISITVIEYTRKSREELVIFKGLEVIKSNVTLYKIENNEYIGTVIGTAAIWFKKLEVHHLGNSINVEVYV